MRTFVAVPIEDENLRSKLSELQSRIPLNYAKIKLVEPENFHFTLRFIGEISESKAKKLIENFSDISFSPFQIEIANFGCFPSCSRPRVLWVGTTLGVEQFKKLKQLVDEAVWRTGIRVPKEKFSPHLTIGRVKRILNFAEFKNALNISNVYIGRMVVDHFVLMKSKLTPSGPIYSVVEKFELNGGSGEI